MTTATQTTLTARHLSDNKIYNLSFPVSQLGNAIAVCGWTLANQIRNQGPEAVAELERLGSLDSIDIPNARQWFAKYAGQPRNDLKPGDILEAQWGYEQTNIDFYRVERCTATMAYLVQLEAPRNEQGNSMTGTTTPTDKTKGPVFRRKVRQRYDGQLFNVVDIDDYTSAQPWDGKPANYTAYA